VHSHSSLILQDQDDGSQLIPVAQWLAERDTEKPLGVYGECCFLMRHLSAQFQSKHFTLSSGQNMWFGMRSKFLRFSPNIASD
jgi:hypothetical protein